MPAYFYLGQPFRDELTVEDVNGVLVDPDTVDLSFRYPDGTVLPGPAEVRDSVGKFHADVTLPVAGQYRRVWTTTGPGAGVFVSDIVMVDPLAPQIVTLAAVKRHLNIDEDNDTFDLELSEHIAALPPYVEHLAGPVLPVTRTEVHTGLVWVLRHPPVASITSALWVGGSVPVPSLEVDLEAGLVNTVGPYGSPVTVTYVSGRVPVPAAVNLAARVIVAHWWDSQRARTASNRGRTVDTDTVNVPGLGFAIPRYAAQLLAPFNPHTGLG